MEAITKIWIAENFPFEIVKLFFSFSSHLTMWEKRENLPRKSQLFCWFYFYIQTHLTLFFCSFSLSIFTPVFFLRSKKEEFSFCCMLPKTNRIHSDYQYRQSDVKKKMVVSHPLHIPAPFKQITVSAAIDSVSIFAWCWLPYHICNLCSALDARIRFRFHIFCLPLLIPSSILRIVVLILLLMYFGAVHNSNERRSSIFIDKAPEYLLPFSLLDFLLHTLSCLVFSLRHQPSIELERKKHEEATFEWKW